MLFIFGEREYFILLPVESEPVVKLKIDTLLRNLITLIVRFNLVRRVNEMTRRFERQMFFNLFEL